MLYDLQIPLQIRIMNIVEIPRKFITGVFTYGFIAVGAWIKWISII